MQGENLYTIVFFSTQETLHAEKVLKRNRLKHELVPPPKKAKTECGLAIRFSSGLKDSVMKALASEGLTVREIFLQKGDTLVKESEPRTEKVTVRRVYMDHNATSPLDPFVLEAMMPYLQDKFGNPSSVHSFGRETRVAIDESREKVARLIGAKEEEIVFTSGGTEANNFAIKGIVCANEDKGNHIITSSIEHHAVLNVCKHMEERGVKVTYLPVDEHGLVDPEEVARAITDKTVLITIMHANNEVGTIEPIAQIGQIAKERGICFHTDAVQTVGKIPVNVEDLGVDLLSLSGHKIYGPKGVGALYIRRGTKISALIQGGHHERGRRAGTENVAAVVGLGTSCEIAAQRMEMEQKRLSSLRDRLQEKITEMIEDVKLNGHPTKRLPNTLNISFDFIEGESLIISLDLKGIAVSTGSACTSGSLEPSHVLSAMGVRPQLAQGSIRFSLGRGNTAEDVDYVAESLVEVVNRLRSMSPLYKKKE